MSKREPGRHPGHHFGKLSAGLGYASTGTTQVIAEPDMELLRAAGASEVVGG